MTGELAYRELYNQEPPANAHYGVDISWWQGNWNDVRADYDVAYQNWLRWSAWAEWVTIRLGYGNGNNDGAQLVHLQVAHDLTYRGLLGAYWYLTPGAAENNAQAFLSKFNEIDPKTFHHTMIDWEEGMAWSTVDYICKTVEDTLQIPNLCYLSKAIADNAGSPPDKLHRPWFASYQNGNYTAFAPTSDWNKWQAPYIPNAYQGYVDSGLPFVWQYGSSSNILGSLDLNITLDMSILGSDLSIPTPNGRGPIQVFDPVDQENTDESTMAAGRQLRDVETGTVWLVNPPFKMAMHSDDLRKAYVQLKLIVGEIEDVHNWNLMEFQTVNPNQQDLLEDILRNSSKTSESGGAVDVNALANKLHDLLGRDTAKQVADEIQRRLVQ